MTPYTEAAARVREAMAEAICNSVRADHGLFALNLKDVADPSSYLRQADAILALPDLAVLLGQGVPEGNRIVPQSWIDRAMQVEAAADVLVSHANDAIQRAQEGSGRFYTANIVQVDSAVQQVLEAINSPKPIIPLAAAPPPPAASSNEAATDPVQSVGAAVGLTLHLAWAPVVNGSLPQMIDDTIYGWMTNQGNVYAGEGYPVSVRRFSLDTQHCAAVLVQVSPPAASLPVDRADTAALVQRLWALPRSTMDCGTQWVRLEQVFAALANRTPPQPASDGDA